MVKQTKFRQCQRADGSFARPKVIEVTFAMESPDANEVYLCGDFNNWSPTSLRMSRTGANGRWEKRLVLAVGRHEYKFVVDGGWRHDPKARKNSPNAFGSLNSVLEVR